MPGFNIQDYVDVAERIRIFYEKYPEGSLQSELTRLEDGWLCKAYAYREPGDAFPATGHAFEPVPGRTPYTKDSEAMNAETSAWGRAIVALGIPTKKIASVDEVRNRQPEEAAKSAAAGDLPTGHASSDQGSPSDEVEGLTAAILAAAETLQVFDPVYAGLVEKEQQAIVVKRREPGFEKWLRSEKAGMESLVADWQKKSDLVEA